MLLVFSFLCITTFEKDYPGEQNIGQLYTVSANLVVTLNLKKWYVSGVMLPNEEIFTGFLTPTGSLFFPSSSRKPFPLD